MMTDQPGTCFVGFGEPLSEATFVKREKRFLAHMILPDGEAVVAHCPNTGSMRASLLPGAPCVLHDSLNDTRKYRLTWKAIKIGEVWIGIDTLLPNRLAEKALLAGMVPALASYRTARRERFISEHTRIDLELGAPGLPPCYVEVKNVTLVEEGVARFPDAVTLRGKKHLEELSSQVAMGNRGAIVFVVQRGDGVSFRPAADIDPEYAKALVKAASEGVEVYALSTLVTPTGVHGTGTLPVELA